MVRPSGPKIKNSGKWTQARYNSFITSALRQASRRWGPNSDAKKAANVKRGFYKCAGCGEIVPASIKPAKGRRKNNIHVDHINPIVDPNVGFENWDIYIAKMFCETDGLQILCTECHDVKTNEERGVAKLRRQKEKEKE